MRLFSIGYPENERLEIEATGESKAVALDDWLPVRVKISAQGFIADVSISIFPADAVRFKEALEPVYRNVGGTAEFKTLEDQLSIKIEVDKLGHVTATGVLKSDFGASSRLHFILRFDQTLLWHTISEIDEFLFAIEK